MLIACDFNYLFASQTNPILSTFRARIQNQISRLCVHKNNVWNDIPVLNTEK